MKKPSTKQLLYLIIIASLAVLWAFEIKAIYWAILNMNELLRGNNLLAFIAYLFIHTSSFLLSLIFTLRNTYWNKITAFLQEHKIFNWMVSAALIFSSLFIFALSDWGIVFSAPTLRVLYLLETVLLLYVCINNLGNFQNKLTPIVLALLLIGSAFAISSRLRRIIDYPFSLAWSEGNRFWDYSILFGRDRYDLPANKDIFTLIDFGRQSLWGMVFLIKDASIQLMRFWNDFLYVIPSLILGLLLFKKRGTPLAFTLFAGLWTFLFLNQGPIYTPIILALYLVIIASKLPILPAFLLVTISGYYAQLTRYTWSIAPALWAGLFAMLKINRSLQISDRLKRASLLIAGGLFGGVILPMLIPVQHGIYQQPAEVTVTLVDRVLTTLGNQDLIWSRLLPNSTNAAGILLSIILASVPFLFIIIRNAKVYLQQTHILQKIYLGASLVATFCIGLVVSVKIGGGSNLHNFDLYLLTVLVLAGILHSFSLQTFTQRITKTKSWHMFVFIFSILLCFRKDVLYVKPYTLPSKVRQREILTKLQNEIDERKNQGDILFIDQRQLLTFGYLHAPLVDTYEKKMLMNEALSSDYEYYDHFYKDLANSRFSLIINEPVNINFQESEASYGAENDAYVKWVSEPLLCYYEPLITYREVGVELLIPRTSPIPENLNCP